MPRFEDSVNDCKTAQNQDLEEKADSRSHLSIDYSYLNEDSRLRKEYFLGRSHLLSSDSGGGLCSEKDY